MKRVKGMTPEDWHATELAGIEKQKALLREKANPVVDALSKLARGQHHYFLDGKGTHTPDCVPCIALAALALLEEGGKS